MKRLLLVAVLLLPGEAFAFLNAGFLYGFCNFGVAKNDVYFKGFCSGMLIGLAETSQHRCPEALKLDELKHLWPMFDAHLIAHPDDKAKPVAEVLDRVFIRFCGS